MDTISVSPVAEPGRRGFDVSIIMCTYNRGEMLQDALESIANQRADGVRFEVLIVDNNSTDNTRSVVERFAAERPNWLYLSEMRQGLSHARNTGIANALAPIVAFTDDDVRVAPDWVVQIKHSLDEHPEVDFVGGKVYPRWGDKPPLWLTELHWMPLAVVDHGDEPFYVDAAKPWCMVGANLSVRRRVFMDFGGFSADVQRVNDNIGSTEDHEFQLRLWRAGRKGLYAPSVVVDAEVQGNRLRKDYHRRWHSGHGHFCAKMGTEPVTEDMPELFGIPACFARGAIGDFISWVKATVTGRKDIAFFHENRIRFIAKYLRTYRRMQPATTKTAVLVRTVHDLSVLVQRKIGVP